MVRVTVTGVKILALLTLIYLLIPQSWSENLSPIEEKEETRKQSEKPLMTQYQFFEDKPKVRRRAIKGARTLEGSIYEGLRSDYLISITLPWTLGMFAFITLLLVCMRTDGWLYHLFTDDYVPPAVKKRLDEEARRAAGKKARMEREDNWNEIRRTLDTDLNEVTERVRATIPSNTPLTAR